MDPNTGRPAVDQAGIYRRELPLSLQLSDDLLAVCGMVVCHTTVVAAALHALSGMLGLGRPIFACIA